MHSRATKYKSHWNRRRVCADYTAHNLNMIWVNRWFCFRWELYSEDAWGQHRKWWSVRPPNCNFTARGRSRVFVGLGRPPRCPGKRWPTEMTQQFSLINFWRFTHPLSLHSCRTMWSAVASTKSYRYHVDWPHHARPNVWVLAFDRGSRDSGSSCHFSFHFSFRPSSVVRLVVAPKMTTANCAGPTCHTSICVWCSVVYTDDRDAMLRFAAHFRKRFSY